MSRRSENSGLVYSSEHGRMCPHCGLPQKRCVCRKNPRGGDQDVSQGDGIVRVRREKKGRKGKTVTTLTGIPLSPAELKDLIYPLAIDSLTDGDYYIIDIDVKFGTLNRDRATSAIFILFAKLCSHAFYSIKATITGQYFPWSCKKV